ncbi:TFIIF-interacting CTD phosphatase, including NLI-interacting factor, partial [Trachipleistophora hominis]
VIAVLQVCMSNLRLHFKPSFFVPMVRYLNSFLDVGKIENKLQISFLSIFAELRNRISPLSMTKKHQLPPQQQKKPVILFNPENLLLKRYPSFLDLKIVLRPYSDIFLFDLAQNYELISYGMFTPSESKFIYKHLDPYGCINYRINTASIDLNRDTSRLIVIETENRQWDKKYDENILRIESWNGKDDERLFLLDQFLSNLLYTDKKSWLLTLRSYLNTPFFQTYEKVQRKLFFSKNFFNPNYDAFIKQVKDDKLKEFERAKLVMDEQIRKDETIANWIKPIFGLIRQLIL